MKYIYVYQQLKNQIEEETYLEGDKLPSLRQLTTTFDCSMDTIKKALSLLVEEQYIYAKNRSGYYVLQKKKLLLSLENSSSIDFGSSRANLISFPYSDFMLCLKKATENYKADFFTYGSSQGLPELITTLKKWFETKQIYTKENTLFITTGTQQALYILSRLLFPNWKRNILIELPSYHLMLDLLTVEKLPFLTIERDENGLDWELLETYFKQESIKFFYTTPRISSPLGLSYSEKEKKKLIYLANKYDVYLVEDDYLGDFISDSSNLPLHYYDTEEKVIYLKSFSKIMFPGLRLGACLLPSQLREEFIKYRTILEVDSSMFSQAALNLYIKSGMFNQHIKDTLMAQKQRDIAFTTAAKKNQSLFHLNTFETAKSFFTLPENLSVARFEKHLKETPVRLEDISRNVPDNYQCQRKIYTLEFLQLAPEKISEGINLLITTANDAKKTP